MSVTRPLASPKEYTRIDLMPRIAHSKRPNSLRRKRNRKKLVDTWLEFKAKGINIRDVERLTGLEIGTTTLMLQGRAKMDQVTVILLDAIARQPSLMREIELMWNGHSIDEIATIMVHES